MAVLVTAEVAGQTEAGYDGMLSVLGERLRQAPGFVVHTAFPIGGGWRVVEIWQTKADADAFFANLPPGIHPKRSVQPLHSLVTR
jgi:hypothetical protein